MLILKNIYNYRYYIFSSVKNELKDSIVHSKLGFFWIVVHPLIQAAVYALILSNILAAKLPGIGGKYNYAFYLLAGILAWTLFNEIVGRCVNLFISNADLIKKMRFPKITLPIITLGASIVKNALLFLSIIIVYLMLGHAVSLSIISLLPLMILLAVFSVSVGTLLAILNVFVRDVGQAVQIGLQLLFWLTPIIYPIKIIPEKYHVLIYLNPLYFFTSSYQNILLYGKLPDFMSIVIIVTITIMLMLLAMFMYRKASMEMMDVL